MPKDPLDIRMYFDPVYIAVVRMIGYSGLPISEASKQAMELAKQFPKEKIQQAANELTQVDDSVMRLTAEARKAARGILGVAPEEPLADFWQHAPPDIHGEENAKRWQDEYRKRKEEAEEAKAEEQPKRRARKGRSK